MAQDAVKTEGEAPKSKKKLLIIIIAAVLILAVVGGGAAFLLLGKKPDTEQTEGQEEAEEQADKHPPIYEKLETFTVNLVDGETFLQVEIHLLVADKAVQDNIKLRMPEIRDGLLRLLSSKMADELSTLEGKDKLSEEVAKSVNDVLGVSKASKGVRKVLFNAFIIQ